MSALLSDVELADRLGITVEDVRFFCRTKGWPCVRPKRSVWRFTEDQVDQIIALQTKAASPKVKAVAGGQTSRSAARST